MSSPTHTVETATLISLELIVREVVREAVREAVKEAVKEAVANQKVIRDSLTRFTIITSTSHHQLIVQLEVDSVMTTFYKDRLKRNIKATIKKIFGKVCVIFYVHRTEMLSSILFDIFFSLLAGTDELRGGFMKMKDVVS